MGGRQECREVCEQPAVVQPTADGWGSVLWTILLGPSLRLFFHPTNVVKQTDLLHPSDVLLILLQPKNLFQPILLFPVIQY